MTTYVSQVEFDSYVSDELGTANATHRQSALTAAARAVEKFCNRSFDVASDTASARVYVPTGSSLLRVHDFTECTAISNNGTSIAASAYQLEPVGLSWTGRAEPYQRIRLLASSWDVVYPGKASVSVTAKWGWAATPAEVVEAVKVLGKDILQQRHTVGNMAAVGDFGGMIRQNIYVRQLLAPLRREEAFGLA